MFKQLLFCLFLLLFISVAAYAQSSNWNNAIDLNVTVNSADRIDLYTDADGNHVIVQKSNQLVYYLFSATGSQIRSSVIDNFSEDPRLSRIAGWEGNVYISYKKSGAILTQKSTDGGANWDDLDDITLPNSTSNGLELWTDGNGLHIAYSAYDPNNFEYNTYYRRHPHTQPSSWQDFKNVTDEANVSGGFPSVTTSANRVHVAFTSGNNQNPIYNNGLNKSRDRYNGTWQTSQQIFNGAARGMVIATSSKLHGFYYDFVDDEREWYFNLYYRNRNLGSTSWSTAEYIDYADPDHSAVDMSVSLDDKLHVLYGSYDGIYNVWDNGWGTPYTITGQYGSYSQALAANSNDIYAAWVDFNGLNIMLRQRDFAPAIPAGLARSIEDPTGDKHPRIDWTANLEADIDEYEVWKKKGVGNWSLHATTSNNYYVDNSETGVALAAQPGSITLSYKLKAVDLQDNKSDFSSTVAFYSGGSGHQDSHGIAGSGNVTLASMPEKLELLPNYPNPFNPTTTIKFGLSEDGPVQLTVYNLTGQEISTLAYEYMEAGYHKVTWNGTDQQGKPVGSGIYIYQLKAGDQRLVKKMMLIK